MCQNTCYSLSSITSGFVSFFAVLVGIFLIALLELEMLIREKTSVERIYHMSPNPSPLSVHCLVSFRSNQFIHLKKIRGLCLMSFNWYRFFIFMCYSKRMA